MSDDTHHSAIPDVVAGWWEVDPAITVRLAGVFEGGGAKGVAYAGALRATRAKGCWFGAVAGASAGAITAALIAAGLTPEEITRESDVAFERLRPDGLRAGLLRLRNSFGFLNNDGLLAWLDELLTTQIRSFGVDTPGPVTFATLYAATGIELNVVAADLTRGCQIVFSVWDTPSAQVSATVLASSAIPFAFPSQSLAVVYGTDEYSHAVVDGGVWSNFPAFVFADSSFRLAQGRSAIVPEDYVVGFLLDEGAPDAGTPDILTSRFAPRGSEPTPREWHAAPPTDEDAPLSPSPVRRLGGLALLVLSSPFWLLLRFGSWVALGRSRAWVGRLPPTKGPFKRVVRTLDDVLSSLHTAWIAGVVMVVILVGTVVSIHWFITSFLWLRVDEIRLDLLFDEGWFSVARELVQVALVSVCLVLVLATVLLALAALLANYLALGASRQVLYGLVRTYAAGPGAPAWAGTAPDDHVVRLPIPKALTTMSFDRSSPGVQEAITTAIADAERETGIELAGLLQSAPLRAGTPRTPREEVDPIQLAPGSLPGSSEQGGGPGMAAARLSIVAVAIAFVLIFVNWVWPDPAWHRYDVNVRACRVVMDSPFDPCDAPQPGAIAFTALFGPAASGHRTQVLLKVNGETVERSAVMPNPPQGRIVGLPIDTEPLCGDRNCRLRVEALVDGEVVYASVVKVRTTLEVDLDRG